MLLLGDAVIYLKIRKVMVCSAQIDLLVDQAVSAISVSRGDCRGSDAELRRGLFILCREF